MYFVIQPLLVKKLCLYLIEISVEKVPAETHLQFLYRKKTSSVKCLFCIILVITQGRLSNMKEKQVIICNCNIRLVQKYLYFCIVELCLLYWHTLFNKCDYVIHQKKKKEIRNKEIIEVENYTKANKQAKGITNKAGF